VGGGEGGGWAHLLRTSSLLRRVAHQSLLFAVADSLGTDLAIQVVRAQASVSLGEALAFPCINSAPSACSPCPGLWSPRECNPAAPPAPPLTPNPHITTRKDTKCTYDRKDSAWG